MQDVINGRQYSLWPQFVEKKDEFVGGELQDLDPSFGGVGPTVIVNIDFRANGKSSVWFEVAGEDYTCGGDVECLGIIGGDPGWITLSGYGGHAWRFREKQAEAGP